MIAVFVAAMTLMGFFAGVYVALARAAQNRTPKENRRA